MNILSRIAMVFLFVLAFFMGLPIVHAQLPTGTILGVVHDSTGAVVPGASVTARETETNQSRTATSGGGGDYRFDGLPVGSYEVTVKATGFETAVQTGLTLAVGQEAAANFTLQVGSVSQTVSVTAEAANLVSTTESSLSSLVAPQTISDLPLNGRNYVALTLLQPGVTNTTISNGSTVGYQGTEFSANGAPFRSNVYLLDGAILNNMVNANGASASGTTLGVDAIQEFSILTNGYPAEYGWVIGAQQVMVSKSGTNSFHGDVFDFLRNSSLDSRNYFDLSPSRLGLRLPPFRRNQFGGSVGGPIQKDKTFFFATYEGLRSSQGLTETGTTLAAGCRGTAGTVITPAECSELTSNATIAPQMVNFINLYPLPNLPSVGPTSYGYVFQQIISENYAQIRVDHTFSNSDNVFARYTMDQASLPSNAGNFNESEIFQSSTNQFVTLAENHIFSPDLLNSARISYSGDPLRQTTPVFNPLLTTPAYELVTGHPMGNVSPGTISGIGVSATSDSQLESNIWTGSDDMDYNRGKHSIKFGFLFNFQRDITANGGYVNGNATMNGVAGLLTGAMTTFGGVLGPLGLPPYQNIPANVLNPQTQRTFDYDTMGFYVQDSWKIFPRLTLNGGMRYEPETPPDDIHGQSYNLRNPATDSAWTQGAVISQVSLRDWAPRVGFAWDVFGDGKTSLRGGFGIYYDLSSYGSSLFLIAEDTPPYSEQYTLSGGTLQVPNPAPAPGAFPYQENGLSYHWNTPHLLSWNLTGEHQLPGQIGLTVAYAGSRGLNLTQTNEGNPVEPTGVPTGSGATTVCSAGVSPNPVINTSEGSYASGSRIDGQATSCYLPGAPRVNPNPAIAGILIGYAAGISTYNALEVNAVKHTTHGLEFQTSYTWGRLIDDGQGESFVDVNRVVRDPLDKASDRSVADQSVEQALNINMIYHLPGIDPQKAVLSKFTNGWYVAPIASGYTGHYFTPSDGGNRTLDGNFLSIGTPASTPDLVSGRSGPSITSGVSTGCASIAAGTPLHTVARWYDPCAFSIQPTGFIGNVPRNLLIGPGVINLDFAIVKDTKVSKLGEGGMIEFRSEFFNVLNHVNFALPNATIAAASCSGAVAPLTPAMGCQFGPAQAPASTAGLITATNGNARQIQFALKVIF